VALSACSALGVSVPPGSSAANAANHAREPASPSTPIQHVIIMVQENRTFNDLFATFYGATATTTGKERVDGKERTIALKKTPLEDHRDLNHLYHAYLTAFDGGKMDAFNEIIASFTDEPEGSAPYEYVNPSDVAPYWTMAKQYGLANKMFSTQGSGSFSAHQDLIRGGTEISSTESIIDYPSSSGAWGCDSRPGTKTDLITTKRVYERYKGPFPCTSDFPSSSSYETLADLMNAAGVSWKYYTPEFERNTSSALWNAFDVIAKVRYGSQWGTNVVWPETTIFSDLTSGTLPALSWVIPTEVNSDHPASGSDTGPSWVSSVVNAVGASSYWKSSAVIVVWDDWGGFYDPVRPPHLDDQGGPGFRVPMILVSPYVPSGEVSNTVYTFGSIVKFVEDNWNLGSLGTTDGTSTSIANMFDFKLRPRKFKKIDAKYSKAFFLRQKAPQLPVDTE
jgi:phospholipase C